MDPYDMGDMNEEDGEFYLGKRKRNFNKDDAIYGIFNDAEEDEEEERPAKRGRGMNFAAPGGDVDFVQSSTQPRAKAEPAEGEEAEEDDERPGLGGSAPAPKASNNKPTMTKRRGREGFAGQRDFEDIGKFEQFTKGFGSKMLAKMGYVKGMGLGREGTGIAEPIEVKKRPKKVGIAFGGFDERTSQAKRMETAREDSDDEVAELVEQKRELAAPKGAWRKGNKTRDKVVYKTADQVAKAPERQVIIDMTSAAGPRRITSISQIETAAAEIPEAQKKLPELQYNLRQLVELSEMDIQKVDKRVRSEQERAAVLGREKEELTASVATDGDRLQRLGQILEAVAEAQKRAGEGRASLAAWSAFFKQLRDSYYDEYQAFRVADLAIPLAFPLFTKMINEWAPLGGEHGELVKTFAAWRPLLELRVPEARGRKAEPPEPDVYTRLVETVWLLRVRTAIANDWDARECVSCVQLVEEWMPVLPKHVTEHVLFSLLVPKLTKAVDAWNPRQDVVPIHSWLHPWLPLLGDAMRPLYAPIRHKLASALQEWHPSDESAKLILMPWKSVFDASSMEQFLARSILPRLEFEMRGFVVDPRQQVLGPFLWLVSWVDLLPINHIVGVLDKLFFPKWFQVLYTWLSAAPSYEEVTTWYLNWKNQFPEALLGHDRIRYHFKHALDVMNQSVTSRAALGAYVPEETKQNMSYLNNMAADTAPAAASDGRRMGGGATGPEMTAAEEASLSFRQLIEKFAESHGILMIPSKKRHQGHQIYKFGNASVYVDAAKELVFALKGRDWRLVTLDEAVALGLGDGDGEPTATGAVPMDGLD